MTNTQAAVAAPSPQSVKRLAESRREPKWLRDRRLAALEVYRDGDMPDTVTHLWRYSDPETFLWPLDAETVGAADSPDGTKRDTTGSAELTVEVFDVPETAAAVLENDALMRLAAGDALEAKNILLLDLHEAAHHYPSLVERHFAMLVPETHGKIEALNLATWQGGVFLHIPRNVVVGPPIHLLVAGDGTETFLAQRLLIVAEEGAEATVVVEFAGPKTAAFYANTVVELAAGANSKIEYVCVQRWGDAVKWFLTQRTRLERDAQFHLLSASLGGRQSKLDLGAILAGPGSDAQLHGVTFAHRKQRFDQHTEHRHASGRTTSNLDFKVVLKDKARSAYTGLIRIDENAMHCEAYQENRNLLLDEGPRVDTIPELEILNDEVKCSHGATLGPIDPMQLFYLQARGIARDEAVRLIVAGFVETTLARMPEAVQERLHALVAERLKDIR